MTSLSHKIDPSAKTANSPPSRRFVQAGPRGLWSCSGNIAIQTMLRRGQFHAKLAVSQPGDPEELEADRIAERVTSSIPSSRPCPSCEAAGSMCFECENEVRRKESSGGGLIHSNPALHSGVTPFH